MAHRQGQALSQPRTRWVWSWSLSWGTESRTTGEEASAAQLHQAHVTVTSHAYRGIPAAHVNVEADVKVPDATVHTLFMPHASAHAAARHTISQTLTHTSDQANGCTRSPWGRICINRHTCTRHTCCSIRHVETRPHASREHLRPNARNGVALKNPAHIRHPSLSLSSIALTRRSH